MLFRIRTEVSVLVKRWIMGSFTQQVISRSHPARTSGGRLSTLQPAPSHPTSTDQVGVHVTLINRPCHLLHVTVCLSMSPCPCHPLYVTIHATPMSPALCHPMSLSMSPAHVTQHISTHPFRVADVLWTNVGQTDIMAKKLVNQHSQIF